MNPLLLFTQVAGFFVIASVVVLLYRRRIFIDAETRKVVEFEIPVFGRIKSQNPVIAMLLVGAGLVLYPGYKSWPEAYLEGSIDTKGIPATVMISAQPTYNRTQYDPEPIKARIPLVPNIDEYVITISVNDQVLAHRSAHLETNSTGPAVLKFSPFTLDPKLLQATLKPILPKQEGSDDEIRKLKAGQ